MGLGWTVLLGGMLGLAGYWVARDGFRQPAGLTRALAAVVVAWTWATLGMEVLGAAGALALGPLLAWTGLGAGLGGWLHGRRRGEPDADTEVAAGRPEPWGWEAVVALGLVLWAALFLGVRSMWQPVRVVSDGPIYHLYFAARWWKEGRLSLIAAPFGETAATYFPAVGDLWLTWLMTAWGGDRLAKVGQAPFLVAAGLAAFAMARRLGAGFSSAVVGAAWFVTSTPLLLFSFEANVDTIFVAGYLLAALFFVRYATGDDRASTLILGGLAAGGALGTKAIGVVFVPPLLGLAALAVLTRRGNLRRKAGHLAALAVAPLVMAGFWYARNALLTGNPLYPLHLVVGGRVWLAGWYGPDAMRSSSYYLPVEDWRAFCDILLAVIDPRMALFWIAALLGFWGLGRSRPALDRGVGVWVWACSGLAVLNVALYWLVVPYRTQQRFMLQALGLAVVPLARLLDRGRWLRLAALALLAAHLVTPQNWPFPRETVPWDFSPIVSSTSPGLISMSEADLPPRGVRSDVDLLLFELATVAVAAGSIAVAWTYSRIGSPAGRRGEVRALLASLALLGLALALYFPWYLDPRRRFYPEFPDYFAGWLDLETRLGPSGARIAYAGTDLPYYLLGPGLRNEVRFINVDARRTWLMHDYHREAIARGQPTWPDSRPGWDRLHPDYDAWLANLRAERIQILVVARANPAEGRHNLADPEWFPIERVWADAHPETFELLYGPAQGDRLFRIYRVRPPRTAAN